MRRLVVSVEGQTELDFVALVLRPHLLQKGWDLVKPVNLHGSISVPRVRDEVRRLANPKICEMVTTLYDLYGFQGMHGQSADAVEQAMRQATGDIPAFVPYVQRHEFEALLLSDPAAIAALLEKPGAQPTIRNLTGGKDPEDVDDGRETCPSRRILKIFPEYNKVLHGPTLAQRIGLGRIAAKCPRFAAWLTRLENAAADF